MSTQPEALPEKAEGWTRRMTLHLNFGDGGAATYTIHDAQGADTGIVYQYDTRKGKPAAANGKKTGEPYRTGYHVPAASTEVYPTWAELRAAWPGIRAAIAKAKGEA